MRDKSMEEYLAADLRSLIGRVNSTLVALKDLGVRSKIGLSSGGCKTTNCWGDLAELDVIGLSKEVEY